jgi:cobalt/nickel transport system permease protein
MNLTPLIGILTGPAIGSLVVLVVNIFSALVGHGGWGLIGANTTVNISEVITAYYVFKLTKNKLEIFTRGAVAAILGLSVGNVALILIIAISGISGSGVSGSASILYLVQIPLLNFIVAVGEAVATGYVVLYLSKVRPDLIGD